MATSTENRFSQIEDFLFWLHSGHPSPRRSYLEWSESLNLTLLSTIGRAVIADLAIGAYPGKWTRAVENSIKCGLKIENWDFWQSARLYYLELGGEYKDGFATLPLLRRG